jgi:hypothetical protein
MEMKADKPCRVSRRKLRNLFGEGIEIQHGKEVVSIAETSTGRVKVTFKDGSDAEGDVVVGCDGAHSITRSAICGKEDAQLTKVPLSMFNFTAKFEAEQAKHIRSWNPLFLTSIHPDNGILFWLSSTFTSSLLFLKPKLTTMCSPRCTRPKRPLNMDVPSPNVLDRQPLHHALAPRNLRRSPHLPQSPSTRVGRALEIRRSLTTPRHQDSPGSGHVLGAGEKMG